MEKLFEIVKELGFGLQECPYEYHSTGLIFRNYNDAKEEADRLWEENVSEKERKDSWCYTHYCVKERIIK